MQIAKRIIAICTIVIVITFSVVFLIADKKEFLESENRVPQSFPDLSLKNITSGDFTPELEEYLKDHFPFRDRFMKIKTHTQLALGYKKISGVFTSETRLFQEVTTPDSTRLTDSANLLFDNISSKDVLTGVMLIPTASEVYRHELPEYAEVIEQSEIIDDILGKIHADFKLNTTDILKDNSDMNMFYKSDHHWTSFAALLAYDAYCNMSGIPHSNPGEFEAETVSQNFKGTLHSKIPDDSKTDEIIKYFYPGCSFTTYAANGAKSELYKTEYFADEYIDKKDQYSYFGNGNLPLMVLENESAKSLQEIVIIKDSFANCMIPHFTEFFKKVHVIDPRYFKGKKISEYINENNGISHVLVIYGLNSLNDNSGISSLS